MTTFILLSLGIFLFLLVIYLIVKKEQKKSRLKRGNSIAKKMDEIKKGEEESHLGKRLFYKIKSGLFKR
jgi:F0F1-type ATP synthase membrane subunit b/b'